MNAYDIELPPLPDGYGPSITAAMRDYALSAIEAYTKRIAELEAARIAYASEFAPDEDGNPDVGSIHENIRKLKAELKKFEGNDNDKGNDSDNRKRRGSIVNNASASSEPDEGPMISAKAVHAIVAGALYDFMGRLTTREERLVLSATDEAGPAVDAIVEFANLRGLRLDDAAVFAWRDALDAPQPAEPEPCFCDRMYPDSNPDASCGDCPIRDYKKPVEMGNKTDWNAELTSWSDEDFIQVFHERPDLADRLCKVLAEPSRSEPEVSTTQALITLGKVVAGYRPGEEGWTEHDQQVYDAAMSIPQPLSGSDMRGKPCD